MPGTAIAANLSKALNIESNFFSELAFNFILSVNKLTEAVNLFFGEVICLGMKFDASLS